MAKNITNVNWSATNLPTNLTINSTTGVISGTANVQPGDYTASITVTTNYGTDTKNITIRVKIPDSWKPTINENQLIECDADETMTPYTVTGQNVTKTS